MMGWLRGLIRGMLGRDERYHRQASEMSARNLETEQRRRRINRLADELSSYEREIDAADHHFDRHDRRRLNRPHFPERRHG